MEPQCEQCPNAEPGVACLSLPTCKRTAKMPTEFTARDVLTFLYGECTTWEEDVDGDCEDGVMRTYVNHTVRLRDGLLDELLDMAGIKRARYDESALEALKRANDEDMAADANCEHKLRELGNAARTI